MMALHHGNRDRQGLAAEGPDRLGLIQHKVDARQQLTSSIKTDLSFRCSSMMLNTLGREVAKCPYNSEQITP